jgi:hypothetical protein
MAPRLMRVVPGSMSGLDFDAALSLRNATIDPVNVTAPMNTPMNTSAVVDLAVADSVGRPRRRGTSCSRPARPPDRRTLCSIAMSSGMPVISTAGPPDADRRADEHRHDDRGRQADGAPCR